MSKQLLLSIASFFLFAIYSNAQHPATAKQTNSVIAPDVKANPNAPQIVFETTSHDFGTLKKGEDCTFEFKFKNTGKEPLIISNCQASCGCTTPMCPKEPIGPGSSGVIKVKYDSNRVGVFTKTVTVASNAQTASVSLMIKGTIEATPVDEGFPGKGNAGM